MRAGGVAIYQKESLSPAVSHTIEKVSELHDPILLESDSYGDVCAAKIAVDEHTIILFCVYVSPNTTLKHVKAFMARNLFHHLNAPIIVTGDFNVDIAKEENISFVQFMKDALGLDLVSNPRQPTTLGGTCIDLIFARKTPDLPTKLFVTYFSYHRPMFTLLSAVSR